MTDAAFTYWLSQNGDRNQGVAIMTGMPEHPVQVWLGGEWGNDSHGRQSADIRYEHDAAIEQYYEGQGRPADGDEVHVYDPGRTTTYRFDTNDEGENGEWVEIAHEDYDLDAFIREEFSTALRRNLDDALLAAAKEADLIDADLIENAD